MKKGLLELCWAHKLGGTESQGISRAGQTVLDRLIETQMWHLPAGSVALCGAGGSEKGQCLLPTFLWGRKLSFPSSSLEASHFCSSLYAIGVFQDATLMLELRGSESE